MPRTSYGDKKRSQAWKLVAALMERQEKQGVQFYQNGAGQACLKVEASLLDMGRWSSLSIDDVREALTQHLNKNFLGIVADQREQKAGRGAEQWKFELKLWSTNQAENQQQFDKAWKAAKFREMPQIGQADPLLSASGDHLSTSSPSNEARFEQVREHCRQKILSLHSRMRLLSGKEVGVDQLYVDVWLLDREPRTFQVSQSRLLQTFDLRNDRLGLGDRIQRNPGFEVANQNPKLVILGKPGSGKTTFLKHLAVDWCNGRFQPCLIAVLIEFRRIRDEQWHLLDAIGKELGLSEGHQIRTLKEQIKRLQEQIKRLQESTPKSLDRIKELQQRLNALPLQVLLTQGKFLILMDGLDEVHSSNLRRNVQDQLRTLAEDYPKNRLVLTCRTQIMTSIPEGFTSVEVADFSREQLQQFVENWFVVNGKSRAVATQQWETIKNTVDHSLAMKELTVTPVLLSLMCVVLQDEGEMPLEKTSLYRRGIKLLLSRWNEKKQIDGWEVGNGPYRHLSVEQKEELLMEIAAQKFENSKNFVLFEQDEIADKITQWLQLANRKEGTAVLKAIEAQHGLLVERADELWSFSHLTFQEYFTVQWLTQLSSGQLFKKIANYQWQEVVKQLVKSQQPAERLLRLIKQAIDQSIADEAEITQFLTWVLQKAESIQAFCKPSAIRALYFALALTLALEQNHDLTLVLTLAIDLALEQNHAYALALDLALALARNLALDLDLALARTLARDIDPSLNFTLDRAFNSALELTLNHGFISELANQLGQLRAPLHGDSSAFFQWWQINRNQWVEQLRQVMIDQRNIGNDWQFNDQQKQQLQRYYDANRFLVNLMQIQGAVSEDVRAEIEDSLLLPWEELQRRQPDVYR